MTARQFSGRIIDADAHITEPADLWTSRVSSKWGDAVPHVVAEAASSTTPTVAGERTTTGMEHWYIGDVRLGAAAGSACYGWPEHWPSVPPTFADAHPASYDANERLKIMDASGIYASVLYPNFGGFASSRFLQLKDPELMLACVQAYNDFVIDWIAPAPERFIPVAAMPFWDIPASAREVERAAAIGHKAILFSGAPHEHGQPFLADPVWNPIWAAAQDAGLSVSIHAGSGDLTEVLNPARMKLEGGPITSTRASVVGIGENYRHVVDLLVSGILPRFPELQFVSAESGIGWLPYTLESLDYHFQKAEVMEKNPLFDLLPSEYFRRQVYASYWFEQIAPRLLLDEIGVDRIMFETDFPHPTCLGPEDIPAVLDGELGKQPESVQRAILTDNAAKLYGVQVPEAVVA